MEAKATAKYLRVSPIKVKRVASLVRGKNLGEAINILKLTGNKPAREIEKVVKENYDKTVDFNDVAEAEQYRLSLLIDIK